MEIITSIKNHRIKFVKSLFEKKYRDRENLFILEGLNNASLIFETSKTHLIHSFYIAKKMLQRDDVENFIKKLDDKKVFILEDKLFKEISDTTNSQGIILVLRKISYDIKGIERQKGVFIVLDKINDPGNMGTIIRTCDAFGVSGILSIKGSVDVYSPKVVRSAMGSIFSVPIYENLSYDGFKNLLPKLKGFTIYGTMLDKNAKQLNDLNINQNSIFIFGNEALGISKEIREFIDEKVYIKLMGNAESLNVAIANSIILYEYRNQHVKN